MSTSHHEHEPRTAAATVASARQSGAGCPGSRLWVVAELGDEARYIRGDAITEVARRKLAAGRYGVEVTLASPDEEGRRRVLLWKLPDIGTASTAALDLMAALADDAAGVLAMGDNDDDGADYQLAVTGFGTCPRYVP